MPDPASRQPLRHRIRPDVSAVRYEYIDDNDDSLRWTVLDDKPDSPSVIRTTFAGPAVRCVFMNPRTSAVDTSTGSTSTIEKKIFKSYPAANTVFGRQRAPANSR